MPYDALRRLTLKAELVAGIDSPAADAALRLEVQVARLQTGMKGGATETDPTELAADWCRLGPKDDQVAPLRQRFFAALGALQRAGH